jgi:transcription elongation factor GreA
MLTVIAKTRVWWAETDAAEEYLDGILDSFAAGVGATARAGLPDPAAVLPWAVLRRPTGERKTTGVTGTVLPAPEVAPPAERRVTDLPPGDAEGGPEGPAGTGGIRAPRAASPVRATRSPRAAATRSTGATRARTTASPASAIRRAPRVVRGWGSGGPELSGSGSGASGSGASGSADSAGIDDAEANTLTPDGVARLTAEREHLATVRRPEVIARIRSARELGDLKENSDYHAAREEQSFLEGRIQAIDAILRTAVVADAPAGGPQAASSGAAGIGSTVVLERDGETLTLMLVGSAEADLAAGRVSVASPVGRAALGQRPGDTMTVRTPGGEAAYKVLEVR